MMFHNWIPIFASVFTIVFVGLAGNVFAETEIDREQLGITQEEWDVYKTLHISKKKVKELLAAGITLQEYADHPWFAMHISEDEWIAQRRKGLKNEEIKGNAQKPEVENSLVLISFFLPGYGQFKLDKNIRGVIFSGAAAGCVGLYFVDKRKVSTTTPGVYRKKYRNIYLGLLLVDCVLSAADVWYMTRYADNPDLQRFSLQAGPQGVGLSVRF